MVTAGENHQYFSICPRGFHDEADDIKGAVPSLSLSLVRAHTHQCTSMCWFPAADSGGPGSRVKSRVPPEVICETITSLIKEEGGTISSRYLGRALHRTPVLDNGTTMLGVIKEVGVRRVKGSRQDVRTKTGKSCLPVLDGQCLLPHVRCWLEDVLSTGEGCTYEPTGKG